MSSKKGKKRHNTSKVIFICFLTLSIPGLLALYAYQTKKYTELTNEIGKLEREQEVLIEENKRLISEISVLSSAERIEKLATEELGMHKAESEDIIRIEMTGEEKK